MQRRLRMRAFSLILIFYNNYVVLNSRLVPLPQKDPQENYELSDHIPTDEEDSVGDYRKYDFIFTNDDSKLK